MTPDHTYSLVLINALSDTLSSANVLTVTLGRHGTRPYHKKPYTRVYRESFGILTSRGVPSQNCPGVLI